MAIKQAFGRLGPPSPPSPPPPPLPSPPLLPRCFLSVGGLWGHPFALSLPHLSVCLPLPLPRPSLPPSSRPHILHVLYYDFLFVECVPGSNPAASTRILWTPLFHTELGTQSSTCKVLWKDASDTSQAISIRRGFFWTVPQPPAPSPPAIPVRFLLHCTKPREEQGSHALAEAGWGAQRVLFWLYPHPSQQVCEQRGPQKGMGARSLSKRRSITAPCVALKFASASCREASGTSRPGGLLPPYPWDPPQSLGGAANRCRGGPACRWLLQGQCLKTPPFLPPTPAPPPPTPFHPPPTPPPPL